MAGARSFILAGADLLHVVDVARKGILVQTAGRVCELDSVMDRRATS